MPQRVLFMISSMRGGGSEQQTLLLLRHLDRAKFEPHLFVLDRDGQWMPKVPDDVIVHGYDRTSDSGGIYFPGRALRQQTRYLKELLQRESIDVIYDRTFHMTLIAGPAACDLNVPRVSTIVSPPEEALPMVERRFVELKRRRLAKAYRQSRTVVAVSIAAAESARSYYRLQGKSLAVIYNGVDAAAVTTSAQQADVSRDPRLTLVCVGRMTEEKGHRDLIDAVAATETPWPSGSPTIRLWMVGDGPLRPELEHQARDRCRKHEIEFIGNVSNPAPYISKADALVLPSRFEGMPNVVLEAMALGTPVIATRAGGTIELERDKPAILWCNPNDQNSLAEALQEFSADRKSAIDRAGEASRLVHQHHDVYQMTRQIERLLT